MNPARWSGIGALSMLLLVGPDARATNHLVVIEEILGGCGDAPEAQFVEITFLQGQARWAGCTELEFRDAAGRVVGTVEFTTNLWGAGFDNSALVGTAAYAALPRAPRPDFTMPPLVSTPAGEVCLRDTGRPGCVPLEQCVAYGDTASRPGRAPALDGTASLQRIRSAVVGDHHGGTFGLAAPFPRSGIGEARVLECASPSRVERGARLFFEETFDGNGRTCGTCHRDAQAFTIGPSFVATLPPADPLFVAESDPTLEELELTPLLRGPRTLVLENVDGFDRPPVFRGVPHLLNVGRTAPYGLGGDVPDLRAFAALAVRQHFPRTLARVPGVDFRVPTDEELADLEAFMRTIFAGNPAGLDPWRLVLRPAAARGRELFFSYARCFVCHNGPFLSQPYALPFAVTFDTGVTRLPVNLRAPADCPECAPIGPLEGGRAFDVPTLVGVRDTAPFFHDNSAATLRDAVTFYATTGFNTSPAAQFSGLIVLGPEDIDDLTAFLEALTACGNGIVDRGEACDDGNVEDGDCCSAGCDTAAADESACDHGDACTTRAECRSGTCVPVDVAACSARSCGDFELSPAIVTCAVASLAGGTPRCVAPTGHLARKLGLGMRLAEKAFGGRSPRRARAMLRKAAVAFDRAAEIAAREPTPGCDVDVVGATRDARRRALCVRRCVRFD